MGLKGEGDRQTLILLLNLTNIKELLPIKSLFLSILTRLHHHFFNFFYWLSLFLLFLSYLWLYEIGVVVDKLLNVGCVIYFEWTKESNQKNRLTSTRLLLKKKSPRQTVRSSPKSILKVRLLVGVASQSVIKLPTWKQKKYLQQRLLLRVPSTDPEPNKKYFFLYSAHNRNQDPQISQSPPHRPFRACLRRPWKCVHSAGNMLKPNSQRIDQEKKETDRDGSHVLSPTNRPFSNLSPSEQSDPQGVRIY